MAEHTAPPHWDDADAHYTESLKLFQENDARLEGARTHVAWGESSARGHRNAARAHFQKPPRSLMPPGWNANWMRCATCWQPKQATGMNHLRAQQEKGRNKERLTAFFCQHPELREHPDCAFEFVVSVQSEGA